MKGSRSLALRVALYISAAQVLGCTLTILALQWHWVSKLSGEPVGRWNDLAEARMTELVLHSVRRDRDGDIVFVPSDALRAEFARAPRLQVAVFYAHSNLPLAGSSQHIVELFKGAPELQIKHTLFTLAHESDPEVRGHIEEVKSPFGWLRIVMFGYKYQWNDIFYEVANIIPVYFQNYSLEMLGVVAIGWFALKRGYEPLRKLASQAERIEFGSLDQRFPTDDVPAEVLPLVAAINRALKRLDESAERQRRFLANAAHELRTPVAVLTERIYGPQEADHRNHVRRDLARIKSIVEQLLSNARLDKQPVHEGAQADLVEITHAVIDQHALLATKTRRELAVEECTDAIPVRVDRLALESVLGNLITNALRAEPEGGTVIIRVEPEATIAVIDHGEGVSPFDYQNIFEPFWRKENRTAGTGLGLSIAKEIVDKLGGKIWIEETPGGGATFKIALVSSKPERIVVSERSAITDSSE